MDPSYTHYGPGLRVDQSSRKVAEPLLPPAPPHATVKQNILNSFANDVLAKGGQDLLDEFQSMKLAFDQHARGSNSDSVMFRLLKNEDGSIWNRKCPESAALAIAAFVIRIFGARVFNPGTNNINSEKFRMATHMLFGKDIHAIEGDLNIVVPKINVEKVDNDNYTLGSENDKYNIIFSLSDVNIDAFVTPCNIDQSFFQKKSREDINGFFHGHGHGNVPEIMKEIHGKGKVKPIKMSKLSSNAIVDFIKGLEGKMKKNASIYNNTVTINGVINAIKCSFLIDSAPSILVKVEDQTALDNEEITAIKALPVNVWQVDISHGDEKADPITTHLTLAGAQYSGNEEQNKASSKTILEATLDRLGRDLAKKKTVIDIRLLTGIHKKIVKGNEQKIYDGHTLAMQAATDEINNDRAIAVRNQVKYLSIHSEAHSQADATFAKVVAPVVMVGLAATAVVSAVGLITPLAPVAGGTGAGAVVALGATARVYNPSTLSDDAEIIALCSEVEELSKNLPIEIKNKYRPVFDKWPSLLSELHHERHAITFATLSTILADVISKHSDTDIELIIGCKSAKDRSTSVVAGINLLYPLIMDELKKEDSNIGRFFSSDGYFNPNNLTAEETRSMKDCYDIRLFHSANKVNTGVEANISSNLFINSFFKNVDFIHTESWYQRSPVYTVEIPA